jgi:hypothetical protein
MSVASTTRPNCLKKLVKSSSVASCETPPTKILLVRSCSSRGIARLGSIYYMLEWGAMRCESGAGTYDFTVKVMLLHHDNVDAFGVFEGKKAEATGAAGGGVAHHGALANFTKL